MDPSLLTELLKIIKEQEHIIFPSSGYSPAAFHLENAWKIVHEKAIDLGLVHPDSNWTFTRDCLIKAWNNTTMIKLKSAKSIDNNSLIDDENKMIMNLLSKSFEQQPKGNNSKTFSSFSNISSSTSEHPLDISPQEYQQIPHTTTNYSNIPINLQQLLVGSTQTCQPHTITGYSNIPTNSRQPPNYGLQAYEQIPHTTTSYSNIPTNSRQSPNYGPQTYEQIPHTTTSYSNIPTNSRQSPNYGPQTYEQIPHTTTSYSNIPTNSRQPPNYGLQAYEQIPHTITSYSNIPTNSQEPPNYGSQAYEQIPHTTTSDSDGNIFFQFMANHYQQAVQEISEIPWQFQILWQLQQERNLEFMNPNTDAQTTLHSNHYSNQESGSEYFDMSNERLSQTKEWVLNNQEVNEPILEVFSNESSSNESSSKSDSTPPRVTTRMMKRDKPSGETISTMISKGKYGKENQSPVKLREFLLLKCNEQKYYVVKVKNILKNGLKVTYLKQVKQSSFEFQNGDTKLKTNEYVIIMKLPKPTISRGPNRVFEFNVDLSQYKIHPN